MKEDCVIGVCYLIDGVRVLATALKDLTGCKNCHLKTDQDARFCKYTVLCMGHFRKDRESIIFIDSRSTNIKKK